jgi:hypothetical protein
MIKPKLKRLHSPDVVDLNKPTLEKGEPYCVLLQAMFGPEGVDGEESFDFLVCNDLWISQQSARGAFFGRHYLIVACFNIDEIRALLKKIASKCTGTDWSEVAQKLGRYGKWEFEDYVG